VVEARQLNERRTRSLAAAVGDLDANMVGICRLKKRPIYRPGGILVGALSMVSSGWSRGVMGV